MVDGSEETGRNDDVPAKFAQFVGTWAIRGRLTADGVPAAVTGKWTFAAIADGAGLRLDMMTEIDGMGRFPEYELWGYDPAEQKVHAFSLNKYAVRDHVGDWIGNDRLVVTYNAVHGTKQVIEEITIRFVSPDEVAARVVETVDGVTTIVTELTLSRQKRHVAM